MVVPVETFSAKEDAANEFVRLGASLISPTLMVSMSETELAPSEAVKELRIQLQFHNPVHWLKLWFHLN